MRMKPGRPDLTARAGLFDVPPAADGPAVTFLGVSTLLFDDGEHAVLTDGFFSRPSLLRVGLGRIGPDPARIGAALGRLGLDDEGSRLRAVVPVHTHYDHALDSAVVARRTGADLLGGESAAALLGAVQFGVGAAVSPLVGVLGNDALAMGTAIVGSLALAVVVLLAIRPWRLPDPEDDAVPAVAH